MRFGFGVVALAFPLYLLWKGHLSTYLGLASGTATGTGTGTVSAPASGGLTLPGSPVVPGL